MSRLGCKCGNIMSKTDCPSPCDLDIYYESEILDAIKYNPELRWLDFQGEWDELTNGHKQYMHRPEEVEYWICPECGRIYEVSIKYGRWIRVYKRSEKVPEASTQGWKAIYVLKDMEVDPYTEENADILLADLINDTPRKYTYKISPDETMILAYNTDGAPEFAYELEEKWQPSDEDK